LRAKPDDLTSPAERGIYFSGNGNVRLVVALAGGDRFGLDVHYLPHQCSGSVFEPTYSLFSLDDTRLGLVLETRSVVFSEFEYAEPDSIPGGVIAVRCGSSDPGAEGLTAGVLAYVAAEQEVAYIVGEVRNDSWSTFPSLGMDLQLSLAPRRGEPLRLERDTLLIRPSKGRAWAKLVAKGGSLQTPAPGVVALRSARKHLRPGGSIRFVLQISLAKLKNEVHVGPARTARADLPAIRKAWESGAAEWTDLLLPDERYVRAYRFARNNLVAAARADGQISAGAVDAYDGTWLRDGVFCTMGLLYAGVIDRARAALAYFLKHVPPKDGQFEEYGILIHGLWLYYCITGDEAFLRASFSKVLNLIHQLLQGSGYRKKMSLFLSPVEGYWERSWLGKAFSSAQNVWIAIGLRNAAELARSLGTAGSECDQWEEIAARIEETFRHHPSLRMIHDGHYVKGRWPSGEPQIFGPRRRNVCLPRPVSAAFIPAYYDEQDRAPGLLEPDVQDVVPYLWGFENPRGAAARKTADFVMGLWNTHWGFGGLSRYHVESDPDMETSGPWYLATVMFARSLLLQDDYARAQVMLDWTLGEGTSDGTYPERVSHCHRRGDSERYIHRVLSWPWGEWLMLFGREYLGLRYSAAGLSLEPHVPRWLSSPVAINVPWRSVRYRIEYRGWGSTIRGIWVEGIPWTEPCLPERNTTVRVELQPAPQQPSLEEV